MPYSCDSGDGNAAVISIQMLGGDAENLAWCPVCLPAWVEAMYEALVVPNMPTSAQPTGPGPDGDSDDDADQDQAQPGPVAPGPDVQPGPGDQPVNPGPGLPPGDTQGDGSEASGQAPDPVGSAPAPF